MIKLSEGVLLAEGDILQLNSEMISILRDECFLSKKKRARINFHQSNECLVHEMIVALHILTEIDPHRHLNKTESFHIISGDLSVAILDFETFEPKSIINLSASSTNCYYRLNTPDFHLVIPRSEIVIMHETTQGPFEPNQSSDNPYAFGGSTRMPVESIKNLVLSKK